MTRIRFVKSAAALLRGKDALLVIAPAERFRDGSFLEHLPEEHMRLALDLAHDLLPGFDAPHRGGAAAGTLTGGAPRKLAVGVLPDAVARHNSPTRAEAIRQVTAQSRTGRKGKAAVLVALDDPEHYVAAAAAVARTLPLLSLTSGKKAPEPALDFLALDAEGEVIAPPKRAGAVAQGAREAARLVDTPPTTLDPVGFQKEVTALLRGKAGVTKRTIVGDKLLEAGLGGVHAVGRTALGAPRLIVLTHTPKRAKKTHVALVGKGVTYDTGGLAIKPAVGMTGMKADMGGAAAVLGAFLALVDGGAPCKVSAVIPLAENAVGPSSYKHDDVLTMHSGKTVEINNTDAEGRILLADGVSWAARKLKADVILDAATLTGAQGVATGNLHAGVVSNDDEVEGALVGAGRASGDLCHALPFAPEFYRGEFRSEIADMRNSVANRANAQVSCAAEFIHWHLDGTDARWGHVDLAFPAFQRGRGTGFGVALLEEAVRRLA